MFKIKVDDYINEPKEIECCSIVFNVNGREIRVSQEKDGKIKIMNEDQMMVYPRASNVVIIDNELF